MVHVDAITAGGCPEAVKRMLTNTRRRRRTLKLKMMMVNVKRTLLNMKWSIVIRAIVMANAA